MLFVRLLGIYFSIYILFIIFRYVLPLDDTSVKTLLEIYTSRNEGTDTEIFSYGTFFRGKFSHFDERTRSRSNCKYKVFDLNAHSYNAKVYSLLTYIFFHILRR